MVGWDGGRASIKRKKVISDAVVVTVKRRRRESATGRSRSVEERKTNKGGGVADL